MATRTSAARWRSALVADGLGSDPGLRQQLGAQQLGQVVRLDVPGGTGAVINASHPLPRLVRSGKVEPVELDADLPLGVDPETIYRGAAAAAGACEPAASWPP